MNKKYIAIVAILFPLIMAGGIAFYWSVIRVPSGEVASPLPKVGDAASPFGKFPTDFKGVEISTDIAVVGREEDRPEEPAKQTEVGSASLLSGTEKKPVATSGAVVFFKDTKKQTEVVRYVEQNTGHIYEANLADNSEIRLTNTTVLKVVESLWTNDGENVYMRLQNEAEEGISTLYAKIPKTATTTEKELGATTLSENIFDIASRGTKAFFLGVNTEGAFGIENNLAATGKGETVWRSKLKEWNVAWPVQSAVALTTKASRNAPGFLYFLNPESRSVSIILQGKYALSTLVDQNASRVLYSEIKDGKVATNIFAVKNSVTTAFPLKTFAEKCVWSTKETETVFCAVPETLSGNLPDDWYRGILSFNDRIWKIDLKTGASSIVLDSNPEKPIDALSLMLSPSEKYLIFTDKITQNLLSLKLE